MLTTMISGIREWNQNHKLLDRFEQAHPLLSVLLFQIIVGVGLICAVGGIAFLGGSIIWMFYRLVGAI